MYEKAILNSGDTLSYAFGLSIDTYKGWKRIGHGGGDARFRTYAVRFPEKILELQFSVTMVVLIHQAWP